MHSSNFPDSNILVITTVGSSKLISLDH